MNLFFKASVREESLKKADHVLEWHWFTKEEFLKLEMHSSYNKDKLASVVFGD